jgi:hypothetical protein
LLYKEECRIAQLLVERLLAPFLSEFTKNIFKGFDLPETPTESIHPGEDVGAFASRGTSLSVLPVESWAASCSDCWSSPAGGLIGSMVTAIVGAVGLLYVIGLFKNRKESSI